MSINIPKKRVESLEGSLDSKQNKLVAGQGISIDDTDPKNPIISSTSGSSGTLDYTQLENKPQLNSVVLEGNKTAKDLSIFDKTTLIGGKNITIDEVLPEGGIDKYTLSCFHLDDSAEDVVTGYIPPNVTIDNTLHKFGTGSTMWVNTTNFPWFLNSYESFSFDFWIYRKSDTSAALGLGTVAGSPSCHIRLFAGNYPIQFSVHGLSKDTGVYIDNDVWSHIYVYYNADDRSYHLFLNGREIYSEINTTDFSNLNSFNSDGYTTSRFDEIRISKYIRWTENFTPPTQPYSKAESTGKFSINAKSEPLIPASIDSLGGIKVGNGLSITEDGILNNEGYSSNDFATPLKVKLQGIEENANNYSLPISSSDTLGGVKIGDGLSITEDGTVSAVNSSKSIGEVFYSQSNKATDNPGGLPLFTGESIVSANTIYPEFYSWVENHTELQCTYKEYEEAISKYGECPKYSLDNKVTNKEVTSYKYDFAGAAGISDSNYTSALFGYKTTDGSFVQVENANVFYFSSAIESSTKQKAYIDEGLTKEAIVTYSSSTGTYYLLGFLDSTGVNLARSSNGTSTISWSATYSTIYLPESYSYETVKTSVTTYEIDGSLRLPKLTNYIKMADVTFYPWVFAFNASVPASTAQAAEFQSVLNNKANIDFSNIPENYDYVIESKFPTSNDPTWYRLYKSGWCEQGGTEVFSSTENRVANITLPKPLNSTDYQIFLMGFGSQGALGIRVSAQTETGFTYAQSTADNNYRGTRIYWRAEGILLQ